MDINNLRLLASLTQLVAVRCGTIVGTPAIFPSYATITRQRCLAASNVVHCDVQCTETMVDITKQPTLMRVNVYSAMVLSLQGVKKQSARVVLYSCSFVNNVLRMEGWPQAVAFMISLNSTFCRVGI